jgi:glycosyltransferase involved in cell wall biosynthesis
MKLAVVDANAYWTSQLFAACGKYADVLLLKPREIRAHYAYGGSLFSGMRPRRIAPRVWEQSLPMPPLWLSTAWGLSRRILAKAVQSFAEPYDLILVLSFPEYRDLQSYVRPKLTIYYNYDDYAAHWPERAEAITAGEDALVQSADMTICIADYRARRLRIRHPERAGHIHHIPLGCTPEFMAESFFATGGAKPERLRNLPVPLAGYIGALSDRFDFDFFAEVTRLLPDVTFVLGGRPPATGAGNGTWSKTFDAVKELPNVRYIGWVEHAELGSYLNSFDVLLMPYAHCAHNTSACPAKLWDYMGTGLPIVANEANPEVLLWRELIHIGGTPEAFASAIRTALWETPRRSHLRLEVARQHTWMQLSEVMHRRIETLLTPHRSEAGVHLR